MTDTTDAPNAEQTEDIESLESLEQSEKPKKPKKSDIKALAKVIAAELEETDKKPRRQIKQVIERGGLEFAARLLDETKRIEEEGGMTVDNGDRRRTLGGIFFYLARRDLPEDDRDAIFHAWRVARKKRDDRESNYPPLEWDERGSIVQALREAGVGEISDVKISLTGRLGEIERREYLIISTMEHQIVTASLPKGVPEPPTEPMQYVIYISAKQWERVEKLRADDDEDDGIIFVEGHCAFDKEIDQYSIYTTFVTTRRHLKRDRKERQEKQQGRAQSDNKRNQGKNNKQNGKSDTRANTKKAQSSRTLPPPVEASEPPPIEFDAPEGVSDKDFQKLEELHRAAATFRQKVELLETKPANQQFGLEMTRKLLKNTERQIEMIEKQYGG